MAEMANEMDPMTKMTTTIARMGQIFFFLAFILGGLILWLFYRARRRNLKFLSLWHKKLGRYPSERKWIHWLHLDEILDLTVGEFVLCSFLLAWMFLDFIIFMVDFPNWSTGYEESLIRIPPQGLRARFFRSLGEMNFFFLAWVLIPVARNSIWVHLGGVSFERAIKFHRWLARLAIINMGVHGMGMWIEHAEVDDFDFVLKMEINPETDWSNLSGFLAFLCFASMGVFAFEWIRRKHWEYFYFVHVSLVVLGYVFAYLHMPVLIILGAIPLLLIIVDIIWRQRKGRFRKAVCVSLKQLPDQVTELTVIKPGKHGFSYEGGQYAFVKIPSIGTLQNHPFSISSSPTSNPHDEFTFHVKSMGPNTFTGRLYELAGRCEKGEQSVSELSVSVDGAYGKPTVDYTEFSHLLFVAGGIGITPLISTLGEILVRKQRNELTTLKKVTLVWSCRTYAPFDEWFPKVLSSLHGQEWCELDLYTTRSPDTKEMRREESEWSGAIQLQRPDYTSVLKNVCQASKEAVQPDAPLGRTVGVMACGPQPMVHAVQHVVYDVMREERLSVHFHKERFYF